MIQHFNLPVPPSVNAMYVNIPGKGRAKSRIYQAWLKEAGWQLRIQRPKLILGRVSLAMIFAPPKRGGDLDNRIKASIDLLVSANVIKGDDYKIVREVSAMWGPKDYQGMSITVMSLEAEKRDLIYEDGWPILRQEDKILAQEAAGQQRYPLRADPTIAVCGVPPRSLGDNPSLEKRRGKRHGVKSPG